MLTMVNHFGLAVSDLTRSIEFYELFGFEPVGPDNAVLEGPWLSSIVGLDDAELHVSVLSLGSARLELIEYSNPKGGERTTLGVNDAGNAHIAFAVADVPREYDRFRKLGVRFVGAPVTIPEGSHGFGGVTAVYGYDPDGNCFELISGPG